ncbi:MAG: molybdopterin-dependent oxidoreductase [Acidobacteria bacterium]|nr:molybdopterin-dependent oxidoreductase [Acidobacteriota bacterium]
MSAATMPAAGRDDTWFVSTCDMCYNACTIRVHRVNGIATKIEGIPEVGPNYGKICAKGNAALLNAYNPNRIAHPLRRTNPGKGQELDPGWKEISWEEALTEVAERLKKIREEDPRKLVVASFDTYSFLPLRAFVSAFGTPNFTAGPAGYFCGNGVHPVAYTVTGSNDVHPDAAYCRYLIQFGSSIGFVANSNAMGMTLEVANARMRGMKMVCIDPMLSNTAAQADEWIPIRPGTDAAMALGMMNVLINELGIFDGDYLRRYTNGPYLVQESGHYVRDPGTGKPLVWDEHGEAVPYDGTETPALEGSHPVQGGTAKTGFQLWKESLTRWTPERVSEITTIPAATVRRIAREFGAAAQIGSEILIEGEKLPLRPAAATWYRGVGAHKHGLLNGLSIAFLNVMVGAVDVPGGLLNANSAGPFGAPKEGPDGILVVGNRYSHMRPPYPLRKAMPPQTLELVELFPVSVYARAMLWLGILEPEKYHLPYTPEMLIQCRTNLVANTADPEIMAAALRKIPFMVSIADHHNETTVFADIVLPDTHSLERLAPMARNPFMQFQPIPLGVGHAWNFGFQQPILQPYGSSRHWLEVLWELAHRMGMQRELYAAFNATAHLSAPHQLDVNGSYTWEDLCDVWAKGWCGPDHGLDYFKQHGYYEFSRRTARETYPRAFHRGRIPIYLEHFLQAGEDVGKVTQEMGLDWDTSDYVPLVEWRPCPSFPSGPTEYDLFAVNHKLTFATFTFTAENNWLNEMAERDGKVYNVGINPETARRKGIRDGEPIWIESSSGVRTVGIARLTEGIHPEAIGIPGVLGRKLTANPRARGQGVHFNSLIRYSLDQLDMLSAALDACVKVKISPARKGKPKTLKKVLGFGP